MYGQNQTKPDPTVSELFQIAKNKLNENPDTVIYLCERIIETADEQNNLIIEAKAYRLKGYALIKKNETDRAINDFKDALSIAKSIDNRYEITASYSSIIATYNHLGNEEQATIFINSYLDLFSGYDKRINRQKTHVFLSSSIALIAVGFFVILIIQFNRNKKQKLLLKESESKFRHMFHDSDDCLLIVENNRFIDCNEASLKFFGLKNKEDLINSHPSDLSPKQQPDGSFSKEKADKLMRETIEKGFCRFEWVHKKERYR
jgi:PAS domain S-box-containing protein